jgi:hypothetical protein
MKALGVVWAATRTDRYAETYSFFENMLGVPLEELQLDFGWSRLPDSSQFEMFGPTDTQHRHFSTGPVPGSLLTMSPQPSRSNVPRAWRSLVSHTWMAATDGCTSVRPTATSTG